jgi:hypothetical protein
VKGCAASVSQSTNKIIDQGQTNMKRLLALIGTALTALALNANAGVVTGSGSNVGADELYAGFPAYRLDFTIAGPGVYTFETLNADFDTFIELYLGDLTLPATTFDPIAFDDDGSSAACGSFFCSKIADLSLGAGAYSLFVHGSAGEVGSFQLRLEAVQGPDVQVVSEPSGLAALALGVMLLTAPAQRRARRRTGLPMP